jgi:SOS response regulatory protein OraA/RecX
MCNPRRLGMAFNPPWISTKAGRIKYSTCAIDGSEDHGSSLKGQERVVAIEKAKSAALRLQGKRSHSRFELTQKLLKYGFQDDIITPALDRLAQVGLQSDGEFAEIFARSKWRQAKWGPSRLKMVI